MSDTAAPTPETLGGLEFGEAGIDLTAAIGNLSGGGKKCEQFGNVYALSRSSGSSDTAQMEDIVGPAPLNISNCASPTLSTTPNPANGALGATLNDTADLAGANSPTGNVTFNLVRALRPDLLGHAALHAVGCTFRQPRGDDRRPCGNHCRHLPLDGELPRR